MTRHPHSGRTIGIDLGTDTSSVAVMGDAGLPVVIPSGPAVTAIRSLVALVDGPGGHAEILVGPRAERAVIRPGERLRGFKQLMGRRFDDPDVQKLAPWLPYALAAAPNGDVRVTTHGLALSPPELSALVLLELRRAAEAYLDEPIADAVIAVPARFDNEQRRATRHAGEIAGLDVRRLINEPTAAALGAGAHRGPDRRLAVCDLGAGSFDVSIVVVEQGVVEVISTSGDLFLGGDDVDRVVLDHLVEEIRQHHAIDVAADPQSLRHLLDVCRGAKHRLSQSARADIELALAGGDGAPLEYRRTLRREELEQWTESLLNLLEPPCLETVARCGLRPADLDEVLLVGGATRMPAVQQKLAGVFGRAPTVANRHEVVALGAAVLGGVLDGTADGVAVLDVTSRAIGLHTGNGKYQQVIPRNTTVPSREQKVVGTTAPGQRELELDVYEGESPDIRDNRLLGRFVCAGLPPAPAGQVMIAIDFTVDVDGTLRLSAREMGRAGRTELRLRATAGLTRADVGRLRASLAAR
jgi:molecular chaperone DnaK